MAFYDRVAAADIELKSGEILRVTGLRIQFNIEKTKGSNTNKAEIKISNLSKVVRDKIREKDALVRLYAGYKNDLGEVLLFVGNAQRIISRWETPDIVTHIEAQDGQAVLREKRVSIGYSGDTKVNFILNRFASELGVPLRQNFDIPGFYRGFSFNGRVKDGIDMVTRRFNYVWSITDNELIILPREGGTGTVAAKLSPSTGLVNSPERLFDQKGDLEEAIEKELEWKLTSLLNPRLSPGLSVDLESSQANGIFLIEKVRHYGDTRGNDWYSEIEVKT